MHKSTTSNLATNCSQLVSRLDIGRRVNVNGHFGGFLKYVGKVVGREGIYCGVELDQPIGKHNGTYQNVAYFECGPKHGIFAPTYKVQLEEDGNLDKPSNYPANRRPNKLISKSAIPSLLNNQTAMDWSMMSTTSSNNSTNQLMDHSFISSTNSSLLNYGDMTDLMMNSNTTYIVENSDCLMLSDIEISDTDVLRLEEEEEEMERINANRNARNLLETSQSRSVIMDGPTLDSSLLPIIGDSSEEDEELSTPMVEIIKDIWGGSPGQDLLNHNHLVANQETEKKTQKSTSQSPTNNNHVMPISQTPTNKNTSATATLSTNPAETVKKKPDTCTQAATSKPLTTSQSAATAPTPTAATKKARVSVREMQQVNAKPKVVKASKPPSKSQEIMDKIKASIEADKLKAKKEPKSKVVTAAADTELAALHKNSSNKEQKTNPTAITDHMNSTALPQNKPSKVVNSEPHPTKKASVPPHSATPLASLNKTSGHTKTREGAASVCRVPLKARQPLVCKAEKLEKEQISNVVLLKEELELKHKAEMIKVQQKFNEELGVLRTSHERETQQQKDEFTAEQKSFAEKLDNINAEHEAKKQQIVELQKRIAEIKESHDKLLTEKNMLEERLLKEDQDERNRRLIDEVNSLKYDLECKSQKLVDLRKKNQELQYAVNTIPEKDTENQKLNHRVSDLKLELNQQRELQKVLSQQLEEARRDIKNGKLAYDLLLKDNEMMHYRLEGGASSPESVLYTSANQSLMSFSSPSAVNLRQTVGDRPNSGSRPNSTSYSRNNVTPPRSENGMTKSWDMSSNPDTTLLSLYKEHGHKRILNTPTKIYAPDGTYEAGDSSIASNLPLLVETRQIDLNTLEEDNSSNESAENKTICAG